MNYTIVIPARLQSSRLPNKVMLPIAGKPMLQHVYERAMESQAGRVVIAAGDAEILLLAKSLGAETCVTEIDHSTGTDRVAEAVATLKISPNEVIVGLQGDEPLLPAQLLDQLAAALLTEAQAPVATLSIPIEDQADLLDSNITKVVVDHQDYALYFSRAVIPFPQKIMQTDQVITDFSPYHRHVGLYAYRAGFLKTFVSWPHAVIESLERLEQLRILFHGQKVLVKTASVHPGYGVDTLEDLERVRKLFI